MDVTIRRGRAEDQPAIAAFTEGTFEWGDYVPDRFIEWLPDTASAVFVAADDADQAIGIIRVVMLSPTEAWLHAIRVHADARRLGIGTTLSEAAETWARQQGARVARLLTEAWNEPSQAQARKLGYRDVSHWIYAERDIGPTAPNPRGNGGRRVPGEERLRRASRAEVEPAFMAWAPSDLARVGRGLYPIWWTWRKLDVDDLEEAAKTGLLWDCPAGWIVREFEDRRLHVSWIATTPDDAYGLARAMLDRAIEDGAEHLTALVPEVDWMVDALERIRCTIHPEILWEKPL